MDVLEMTMMYLNGHKREVAEEIINKRDGKVISEFILAALTGGGMRAVEDITVEVGSLFLEKIMKEEANKRATPKVQEQQASV